MSRRLVLAAGASLLLTVAPASGGTPFGGDDGGFLPPDRPAKRCEEVVLKRTQQLGHVILKCHVKTADRAVHGQPYDEEGCEQQAVDDYAARIAGLIAGGGCPACTGPASGAAAVSTRAFVDSMNGNVYCDPGVPFGGDDPGNVPGDLTTLRCEDHATKRIDKFLHCARLCHFHAARRAFRGDAFDDDSCEQVCRAVFTGPTISCVPCLDTAALDNIATQSEQFADDTLGSIYCASPGGAFLDE